MGQVWGHLGCKGSEAAQIVRTGTLGQRRPGLLGRLAWLGKAAERG